MSNDLGGYGRRGNRSAKTGIYVKPSTGEWIQHSGGLLPGTEQARYVRIPAPLVLVLEPLLGGLYLLSLSFMGCLAVVWSLGRRAVRGVMALLALGAETLFPAWVPGRSYLASYRTRHARSEDVGNRDMSDELQQAAREIEELRTKEG